MESLINQGRIIEVGSEEWKAHLIQERLKVSEDIKTLQNEIAVLNSYLMNLEKTEQMLGIKK